MAKSNSKKTSGWRGSEDLWLDGAYQMLVQSGVESVKVMPLAKKLKLSRTSFYWHFEDREALLAALIRRWKEKNTGNLVARCKVYAESITEAILNLFDCWVDPELFDARMDFAIRNWAQHSPDLKKLLEFTDKKRIDAIRNMFSRFGFDDQQAETRALTIYYTQVGYIAMMVDEPLEYRLKKIPAYVETFAGSPPTDSEISRFMARHQSR